jgi:hypothetical protein
VAANLYRIVITAPGDKTVSAREVIVVADSASLAEREIARIAQSYNSSVDFEGNLVAGGPPMEVEPNVYTERVMRLCGLALIAASCPEARRISTKRYFLHISR